MIKGLAKAVQSFWQYMEENKKLLSESNGVKDFDLDMPDGEKLYIRETPLSSYFKPLGEELSIDEI